MQVNLITKLLGLPELIVISNLPPLMKFMKMVKRWEDEILNYFKSGITNGFAEGINNKIKVVKRIGYGIPNPENLRRRILLAFFEQGYCEIKIPKVNSVEKTLPLFNSWSKKSPQAA